MKGNAMNIDYLNTLPDEKNRFKVPLENGERVVFTAKNVIFGTETQRALGWDAKVTMTNKRIIADNGKGVWTIDIAEDIVSCKKVIEGKGLNKCVYFAVDLNKEVTCGDSRETITLTGYVFTFKKKDDIRFKEIVDNVFV